MEECLRRGTLFPHISTVSLPFLSRDLPNFCKKTARDVFSLDRLDDTHALFLRDAAGGCIRNSFRSTKNWKLQHVEPIIGHHIARFAHQTLSMPRQSQPEPSIPVARNVKADSANQLMRGSFEPRRPVPLLAALHCGQGAVLDIPIGSIRRIGPRDNLVQIANDFPVGK